MCGSRLHLGVYGFRPAALQRFVALLPSPLEQIERLEQLRALQAGMRILVGEVEHAPPSVDTRADYELVLAAFERSRQCR